MCNFALKCKTFFVLHCHRQKMSTVIEHHDLARLGVAFAETLGKNAESDPIYNPGEESVAGILLHNTTRHCSAGDAEISRFAEIRREILKDLKQLESIDSLSQVFRDSASKSNGDIFDLTSTFDADQIDLLLNRGYSLSHEWESGEVEHICTVKPIGNIIRKHVQESVFKWLEVLHEWVYKNKMIEYMNNYNVKQKSLFSHSWTTTQQLVITSVLERIAKIVAKHSCPDPEDEEGVRPLFDKLLFYLRRKSHGEMAANAIKLKAQYLDMKTLITTDVTSEELLIRIASRGIQDIIHHPPISLWIASGNGLECFQMLRNAALCTKKRKRALYEDWLCKYGAALLQACEAGLKLGTPELTFNGLLERLTDEKLLAEPRAKLRTIPTPRHITLQFNYRIRIQDCKFLSEQPLYECLHDTAKVVMELVCYGTCEMQTLQFKNAFVTKIAAELLVEILQAKRQIYALLQTLSVRADLPYRKLKESFSTHHQYYAGGVYRLCAISSSCSDESLMKVQYLTKNVWDNAALCQQICEHIAQWIPPRYTYPTRIGCECADPIVLVYNACMLLVPTILETRQLIKATHNLTRQESSLELNHHQLRIAQQDSLNHTLQWQCFYFLNAYVLDGSTHLGANSVLSAEQYNALPQWVQRTLGTLSQQYKHMVSFKADSKRSDASREIKVIVNTNTVWHTDLLRGVSNVALRLSQ